PVGERSFVRLAVPVALGCGEMESARRASSPCGFGLARPNAICHVRVSDVANAGLASVPNVLFEPLDFLVASGQIERYLLDVAVVVVRYVPDLQVGRFGTLSDREKV